MDHIQKWQYIFKVLQFKEQSNIVQRVKFYRDVLGLKTKDVNALEPGELPRVLSTYYKCDVEPLVLHITEAQWLQLHNSERETLSDYDLLAIAKIFNIHTDSIFYTVAVNPDLVTKAMLSLGMSQTKTSALMGYSTGKAYYLAKIPTDTNTTTATMERYSNIPNRVQQLETVYAL